MAAAGRLRYLLTLSRPRFWLYLAGPMLVGVAFAAETVPELYDPGVAVAVAYFLLPANVYLYGVNDAFDAEIDESNPKKERKEARWRDDGVVRAVVVACGLLGAVPFAVLPSLAWPYLAGFLFLATEYSAPPLRFKTTPFLDSLSNGLYILPGAAAYAAVSGSHPPAAALAGAWFWAMGMHTFSAIPDVEPDRAAGIRTTATFLGERRTYAYCFGCWAAAAVGFALVDVRLGAVLSAYPVAVAAVFRSDVDVERAYWWYPVLNTVVGATLTLGALWRLVNG
ncbi:4-hydroxybenzoate polyprenyltransferase [Halopelagius inordinatus]|uniref:4-hydroxybenzoate polyprenyltransferase n=1 Tax=Halopelagius inordinatus TaxID=553467 RepID=A0A1I2SEI0_9EURY|nr:prenyltransferase [Halopelagius inordinatus]SFG51232.1 4-hydroxybenzoate polyprenyltransferase [Halopelagius inordinatus]